MSSMFSGSSKLEYINLKHTIEKDSLDVKNIFDNIYDNIVLCLNKNSKKILEEMINKDCNTLNCSYLCYDIYNNNIFLYRSEYNEIYYENCFNKNLRNNEIFKYCQCNGENCPPCSEISFIKDNYYEKAEEINLNNNKKCYKHVFNVFWFF